MHLLVTLSMYLTHLFQQISSKQCRICMKELINAEQKRYDPLDVNVLVMGECSIFFHVHIVATISVTN